jgi:hypothetical protein
MRIILFEKVGSLGIQGVDSLPGRVSRINLVLESSFPEGVTFADPVEPKS